MGRKSLVCLVEVWMGLEGLGGQLLGGKEIGGSSCSEGWLEFICF